MDIKNVFPLANSPFYNVQDTQHFTLISTPYSTTTSMLIPKTFNIDIKVEDDKIKVKQDDKVLEEYKLGETNVEKATAKAFLQAIPTALALSTLPLIPSIPKPALVSGLIGGGLSTIGEATISKLTGKEYDIKNIPSSFAKGFVGGLTYGLLSPISPYLAGVGGGLSYKFAEDVLEDKTINKNIGEYVSSGLMGLTIGVGLNYPIKYSIPIGFSIGAISSAAEDVLSNKNIDIGKMFTYGAIGGILSGLSSYITRAGKEYPTIKLGYVDTGKEEWFGLYYQKAEKVKPLFGEYISKADDIVKIGGDVRFKHLPSVEWITSKQSLSPLEMYLLEDAIKQNIPNTGRFYIDQKKAFEVGLDAMRKGYKIDLEPEKAIKDVLKDATRLKGIEDDVYDVLMKNKKNIEMIYGSLSQKVYGDNVFREVHDIDIVAKNPEKIVKDMLKKISNLEVVKLDNGYQLYRNGEKIMEIFSSNPLSYYFGNKYVGYGFIGKQPKITEEGLKVMDIGEQFVRKGSSSLWLRYDNDYYLGPEQHRIKDIYDFISLMKWLSKYNPEFNKLSNEFLKTLDRDLAKEIVNQMKNYGVKFEISLSPTSTPTIDKISSYIVNSLKDISKVNPSFIDKLKSEISTSPSTNQYSSNIPSTSYSSLPPSQSTPPSQSDISKLSYSYNLYELPYYNIYSSPSQPYQYIYYSIPYYSFYYSYYPTYKQTQQTITLPILPYFRLIEFKPQLGQYTYSTTTESEYKYIF